ncbi:HAD family hydrolase [Rhodopseudomonas boonkerdii]|uniref:HAD family hydrolase n=1 Tax=Rhodopseudomonas boonkerdii TaxID=475937 RepID=UPI001E5B97BC|nr:HAD family hydrolase [Rhodopseudomonas boonkerdii]UGV29104.1 HAD family hydrolase [Rhodopseudomonas boonkerdii]
MDTIFFDLDGTLTDPKIGITSSIQYALEKLNIPVPTQDELTWCIGPPLRASFVSLLGGEEHADRGVELYRERFGTIGLFENTLYDGIVPVLAALQSSGRTLYVATSKPHVFADRIIDHFDLRKYFARVFGSELDGTRVDKSDLLRYALNETAADPTRTIMIGDRKHDVIGAANNGMAAIGAVYGYGGRTELTEAGAKHLVTAPAEITGLID